MLRVTVADSPSARAVRCSSMVVGYSWSGTTNDPEATPVALNTSAWRWQADGQWSRSARHDRPEAGTGSPSASVADPRNLIVEPTGATSMSAGSSMTGAGTRDEPTITTAWPTAEAPVLSVTRRRPTFTPCSDAVYVWVATGSAPSSNRPAPSRTQA